MKPKPKHKHNTQYYTKVQFSVGFYQYDTRQTVTMLAAPVTAPAEPTALELATLGAFSTYQDPAPSPAQAPVTTTSPPGRYGPGGEGEDRDVCP